MRLKSAYREKPADAPKSLRKKSIPSETITINFDTDKARPVDVAAIDTAIPEPEEGTLALQKNSAKTPMTSAWRRWRSRLSAR